MLASSGWCPCAGGWVSTAADSTQGGASRAVFVTARISAFLDSSSTIGWSRGAGYGYRKIDTDLRESGESCRRQRALRLMSAEGLRAQVGSGRSHDTEAARLAWNRTS